MQPEMPPLYVLALDQGTTSSRAALIDRAGQIVSLVQRPLASSQPEDGWVEHCPEEIWATQSYVAREAMAQIGALSANVCAIGIANQRETTIVWERATSRPVYKAIGWQDRRTAAYCDTLKAGQYADMVRAKTGLPIDPYFSASKIRWILQNEPSLRLQAEQGKLAFGTVDSWLVWRLTNGQRHVTDITNASRTMLFNIHTRQWDPELLALHEIPASMLPEVRSSSEIYAHTDMLLDTPIPIAGIAGDQQAALIGQMCTEPGMVKVTHGTGCFMVMNMGSTPIASQHGLITTIAYQIGERVDYALEASIFNGGAVVKWLRDNLKMIDTPAEIEALAASVADNGGVYFVSALTGLGAPHWEANARATLFGMNGRTQPGHIGRAALESIAYQLNDALGAMQQDARMGIRELRVDGGAAVNNLLLQIQADLTATKTVRPTIVETTALGAAYLAGLAVGFWDDLDTVKRQWRAERTFDPEMPAVQRGVQVHAWQWAVDATIHWAHRQDIKTARA